MSGQYVQGGHVGRPYPGDPPAQYVPRPPRNTGTPLGRIILGVFLGLLAWTVVMAVISVILAATVLNSVENSFNDSSSGSAISTGCKASIDAGGDGTSSKCDTDDTVEVLKYTAQK